MLTHTHTLDASEAYEIKKALLAAVGSWAFSQGMEKTTPSGMAAGLIEAFRLIDEATQPASEDQK